jgi:hypothetical protein
MKVSVFRPHLSGRDPREGIQLVCEADHPAGLSGLPAHMLLQCSLQLRLASRFLGLMLPA